MPTLAMDHRDLISLFKSLLEFYKEAPGAETLFALRFLIAEVELREAYGQEVTLRDCEGIIGSLSAAGRAYNDGATHGTDAVFPD